MQVAFLIVGLDQASGLHRCVFLWQVMSYDIVALRPAFPSGACQDAEVARFPQTAQRGIMRDILRVLRCTFINAVKYFESLLTSR